MPALGLLAASLAIILISRRQGWQPAPFYHLRGVVEGVGPAEAHLRLDGLDDGNFEQDFARLEIVFADGKNSWSCFGNTSAGGFRFTEVDWRADKAATNRVLAGQLSGQPPRFVGTWHSETNRLPRAFEFHTENTFEMWHRRSGFRLGSRGWRNTFTGIVPVFPKPTVLDKFASEWLRQNVSAAGGEYLHETSPSWRELFDFLLNSPASGGWYSDVVWRAEFRSSTLLSLRGNEDSYTGGAHGNHNTECATFWLRDGHAQRVLLNDLFHAASGWERKLPALLIVALKTQEAGWVMDGSLTAFKPGELAAFTLSPAGLKFYFDPYVAGPYAQGRMEVLIPFQSLEGLLNPTGPVSAVQR